MKYGLLISGQLGLSVLKELSVKVEIAFIFTDSNSLDIINFSQAEKIPLFQGNPRNYRSQAFLTDKKADYLLSVNYLFLIDQDLIKFPSKKCINIHGSLLPKYRGRTPHVWAIINNEKQTGVTAHIIDESCDTGDVIKQIKINIEESDTGDSILQKFKPIYLSLINELIVYCEENRLTFTPQNDKKATFFGKRTPSDGKINWNWSKERIYNWVRAQSTPYPGAFTINSETNQKIIVDWIEFSDIGYDSLIQNGTVINEQPILIKTYNGVVEITKTRYPISLKSGTILK